tara:strand:- start:401 stop:757 length:357 start_codon:yes stop_codon:yes gene_type:complete
MGLRETMREKPWIAWCISGACLAVAALVLMRSNGSSAPDSLERRSEMVTIRCTETGEEWEMNRGQFERMLLTSDGLIDPAKGVPSKFADGRPTGVLVNKGEWEETVGRINAMKRQYMD